MVAKNVCGVQFVTGTQVVVQVSFLVKMWPAVDVYSVPGQSLDDIGSLWLFDKFLFAVFRHWILLGVELTARENKLVRLSRGTTAAPPSFSHAGTLLANQSDWEIIADSAFSLNLASTRYPTPHTKKVWPSIAV